MAEQTNTHKKKAGSDDVLDAQEAAWLIGAHVETLRRLARKDEIPAYKVGKDWRFSRKALENWRETEHLKRKAALALVVDDEKEIREMVALFLRREGYRVALAARGEDAVEFVRREMPDTVLLDLKMPGMSGVDVLEKVHEINPDVPVVIVTGYPESGLMSQALRYPPVTLLPKPVDKETLLKTMRRILHGTR